MAKKYKYAGKKLSDMMLETGLLADLIKAKLNAAAILNPGTNPDVTKLLEIESEGIRDAFINFLTHSDLNLTVSEFKASVEIEELKTQDLQVNVKMETLLGEYGPILGFLKKIAKLDPTGKAGDAVDGLEKAIQNAIKPFLEGGATVPGIDARKDGGPSGKVKAVGHAHVGINDPVPNSDTTDDENDFTKVKLFYDKIPKEIL